MMSKELREKLLADNGAWWELLAEDTTFKPPERDSASADLIDWSGKERDDERRRQSRGEWSSAVCAGCTKWIPNDFPFCVHCGGDPAGRRQFGSDFVVKIESVDDRSIAPVAEFVGKCSALPADEVGALLKAPPAVFLISGRRETVTAIVARIQEIGAEVSVEKERTADVGWAREIIESVLRHRTRAIGLLLMAVVAVIAIFYNPLITVGAIALAGGIIAREFSWYRNRYQLDYEVASIFISGMEMDQQIRAKTLLSGLRDPEMTNALTCFLMEYYYLHREFLFWESDFGGAMQDARADLSSILEKNLLLNEHFQTLDDNQKRLKNDIDGIDLRALEKRLVTANSPERRAILASIEGASHDLDLLKETESTVATLRARILDNVELIESLRKRFERIRNRHDPVEELDSSFQSVATELDLELTLMEEATADIEALSTARA